MSDIKVFKCPNCTQYINTSLTECKFCKTPLSNETKQKAIESENENTKLYRRNMSKKHLLIGIGVFTIGIVISLPGLLGGTLTNGGFIFIGLILVGLGEIGNGLFGLMERD
ncbi:MAG: hypothetical protein K1X72_14340 [Pyrinomonadaceae bacterium]|nr:hypothetical protein [Pyrinomonadaceae bacterium]